MKQQTIIRVDNQEIPITNPEKPLFPTASITKWDYVLACARIAPYLLQYAKNRLLTTIRYPHGVDSSFFYQKQIPQGHPSWVETAQVGDIRYILLRNTPTLLWLANLACLEFHLSFDEVTRPGFPPELVFDLDPSTMDFAKVVEVAQLCRQVLDRLELPSFVKTSGARGLQIHVPIQPHYTFTQTRAVHQFVAMYLAEQYPQLITIERKVKARGDKVYIDYLQHWQGKSLIAPYSPRATPEATVATPLQWEEVTDQLSPKAFTLQTIHERLKQKGNLFSDVSEGTGVQLDEILRFIQTER